MSRSTVAVIGAGVSGLTAAYALRDTCRVTVFEAEPRLGGHTHTHHIDDPDGRRYAVDTGFIVHNDRTYPRLRALFTELGVHTRPTEMSMSIHCEGCGLEYAGGRGVKGILASPRQLTNRRFVSLLWSVRAFHRAALAFLDHDSDHGLLSFGDWLRLHDFDDYFIGHYAIPLVSCVWSSGQAQALQYPARYLFTFLRHHGMLSVTKSPQWFTVDGGSATYVCAIAAQLPDIRRGQPVVSVARPVGAGVEVRTSNGAVDSFDQVVIATHADQALGLLADPTPPEKQILGAFEYCANETVLHTDASLLPRARQARASWNYTMSGCTQRAGTTQVTYWMNRLQGHRSSRDYLVTLNGTQRIRPEARLATMHYTHPSYTSRSVAAQRQLTSLFSATTAYAGAHFGWGFHEDGCRSGYAAADWFGSRP
ncbi:MAG: FAD-dependent oxidoreductase [Ornithinimicrobium sp.]